MLFRLALRNILRNPRRTMLTLAAISLGVWSAVGLSALARGVSEQMAKDAIRNFTAHIQIHHPSFLDDPVVDHTFQISTTDEAYLRQHQDIISWTKRIRVPTVIQSERETAGVTLLGIIPKDEAAISFLGDPLHEGRPLHSEDDPGIILGKRALELLHTELGKRVVVLTETTTNVVAERGFRIIGVFDAELEGTEKSFAFVGFNILQALVGLEKHAVSEVALLSADRNHLDKLASDVERRFPNSTISTWRELEPLIDAAMQLQDGFLKIWYLIVVIAVGCGLVNTLFMSIFERIREIGLVQALGMSAVLVRLQVLTESALLLFLGAFLGNALVFFSAYLLRDGIDLGSFAQGAEMVGLSSIIYPFIRLDDALWGNAVIFLLALLSSAYPAWQASRFDVALALRK